MEGETWIEQIARWVNTLNCWEWPEDMSGKPADWDEMAWYTQNENDTNTRAFVISSIVDKLSVAIGEKEVLRWNHIHNILRTNEEFEEWWSDRAELTHKDFDKKWHGDQYPHPRRNDDKQTQAVAAVDR